MIGTNRHIGPFAAHHQQLLSTILRVTFGELEGGIDFRRARKFCCAIGVGHGFRNGCCLSSQIFIRILSDLYADPGHRLAGLEVGNPDQSVKVAHLHMNIEGSYLGEKPVWFLFLPANGGRGDTVPVTTPDSAGISFRIPSGIAEVTSRTGAGECRRFCCRFPFGCKRLVLEIYPIDIACKDG